MYRLLNNVLLGRFKKLASAKLFMFSEARNSSHNEMFKLVDELLNVKVAPILCQHVFSRELAERFGEHFSLKRAAYGVSYQKSRSA